MIFVVCNTTMLVIVTALCSYEEEKWLFNFAGMTGKKQGDPSVTLVLP